MAKKKVPSVVGSICLYGTSMVGAGYLAHLGGGLPGPETKLYGDGAPRASWGMNDAFWLACMDLKEAGCGPGLVKVFIQAGDRSLVALADVMSPPYFGDLKFEEAPPALVIPVSAILAAATEVA